MSLGLPDEIVERFLHSLSALIGEEAACSATLAVAVSGGPDSLALLLLAAAALPGRVIAATIDHRLRSESASEAAHVAGICRALGVPHETLALNWSAPPANRQAAARTERYAQLSQWAFEREVVSLATAHHRDDQTETVLMRLHRGAGVDGLGGIRSVRHLAARDDRQLSLVRPLLEWSKAELGDVVGQCGLTAVDDPSNHDPAHDRTGVRALLNASPDWPDRQRVAASARHLQEAGAALDWVTTDLLRSRVVADGEARLLDVGDLPAELVRRVSLCLIGELSGAGPGAVRGDELARLIGALRSGRVATLAGVVVRPGRSGWRFEQAPPRRG